MLRLPAHLFGMNSLPTSTAPIAGLQHLIDLDTLAGYLGECGRAQARCQTPPEAGRE